MQKKFVMPLLVTVGFSYLFVRLGIQLTQSSLLTWTVFAFETLLITELATISIIKSKTKKPATVSGQFPVTQATAFIDVSLCTPEQLETSLYGLEQSNEFSQVFVLFETHDEKVLNREKEICSNFSKVKICNKDELNITSGFVVWINPGDVVLGDMLMQSQVEFDSGTAFAIPRAAIWSNEIANANQPEETDDVSTLATEYISQHGHTIWAGETCIFNAAFFVESVIPTIGSKSVFTKVNSQVMKNGMLAKSLHTIGLEQQDVSSLARISNRLNEIRTSVSSVLTFSIYKQQLFSALRYAYRPLRAFRTVFASVFCIFAVAFAVNPYPGESAWQLLIGISVLGLLTAISKLDVSSRFDDNTRIRNNFSHLGLDLFSLLTKNKKIISLTNRFLAPTLAISLAIALIARWAINFGDDSASQNSAPSMLLGMTALATLIFGLDLVAIRQRRNSLRRIVHVNAKFGRRAIEIADLSPFDCGVISERPTEIGKEETITLSIPYENTTHTITVDAKVVNSTKVGLSWRVGFVFENVTSENFEILKRFCTLTYPQYALRGFSTIPGETLSKDIEIATKKRSIGKLTTIRNQSKRPIVRVAAIVALFAVAAGNLPPYTGASAVVTPGVANTVSGFVFQDFNANGVKDSGSTGSATDVELAGIAVKATCDNNGTITTGTSTSNSQGAFTITGVSGDCRVETTSGIPNGMKPSASGADSNTTVQFHRAGTANIMFGFHYPGEFCQNNPNVVVSCFGRGNVFVSHANKGSILSNTWNSTGRWTDVSRYGQVGTVYGLAYKSDTKELFSAAYLRRKAGLGPLGLGGIYKTATGTTGQPVTQWLNLETTAQALGETLGANPRPANQSTYDLAVNDATVEEWVGRRGIGDIDISPDNKTLYTTNLNTSSVYAIEIANPSNARKFAITDTLTTSSGRTCVRNSNANDFRIFGLGVHGNGEVYIGGVCTAQSTQNHNDLYMYIFKFDPTSNANPTLVSKSALNFNRTRTANPWQSRVAGTPMPDPFKYYNTTIRWEPWQAKQQPRFITTQTEIYPYPSVSDITFDGNDLIVGMRDIYSDTVPPNGVPQPGSLHLWGSAHGDIVRLCATSSSNYVLESNRRCPDGRTASGTTPNYSESFNGDRSYDQNHHFTYGPGGGEWFTGDDPWEQFGEGALGALAKPGGFNKFVATQSDPANYQFFGNTTSAWSAGTRWFDAKAGTSSNGNTVYDPSQSDYTFSKAGGLGDLEALCDQAPLQIGNRVWLDNNSNGIQDPSEAGIANVEVQLVNNVDQSVRTTTTNSVGEYLFSGVTSDVAHTVRVNLQNLSGLAATSANVNNNNNENIDSDGVVTAHWVNATVLAHSAGDNDHTFDFGFKPVYSIGNLVFNDLNNNGVKGTGETGVPNVAVRLLDGSGNPTGRTTTTDANGKYYFANLDAGAYIVEVTPPSGYVTSTGSNAQASGPYEPAPSADTPANLKIDNDDNGTKSSSVIRSSVITVGPNRAPLTEEDGTTVNTPDSRNDYSIDFGIYRPSSLGDKVWDDDNKNGLQDTGELGTSGVTVTLFTGGCGTDNGGIAIATTNTNSNGNYAFTRLIAGTYFVHFQLPDGKVFTQSLAGSNTAIDSNANTNTGCSQSISLGVAASNLTIDAGLVPEVIPIDLEITKAIDTSKNPTYTPGSNVEYILTITNNGPGTALSGFTVEDKLPDELNFVSATGIDYVCPTPNGQTVTCSSGHGLGVGEVNTIRVVAQIDPGVVLSGQPIVNIATVKPSPLEPFEEEVPLDPCSEDGSNKSECNNRDPISFPLANGASIGDRVWIDSNKNGVQNNGEIGLANVEVLLRNSSGTVVRTTTTDSNGNYLFDNLVPGNYTIEFGSTPGYTITTQDSSNTNDTLDSDVGNNRRTQETTLAAGEIDLTWDMGVYPTVGELGNKVWFDTNANGIQDNGEDPVTGANVYLYGEVCGLGTPIAQTTTNGNGNYLFADLDPGVYSVKFDKPLGSSFTSPNANTSTEQNDSDADSSGCSAPVTLSPGESNLDIDAGVVELASLGDFVWLDSNRDGIQNEDDIIGVPGVHVLLLDSNGDLIPGKETVTDEDGFYIFDGLLPGTYSVQFDISTLPLAMQNSPANQGSDDEKDSDASQQTGITGEVTLEAGEQNITLDLGINPIPAGVGDTAFEDKNKNGIQDEGEPGIEGVMVAIFDCEAPIDADPVGETLTDEDGFYEFTGLEPSSYALFFKTPDGMVITQPYAGTDEALDSDIEIDGFTWCVDLPPGFYDPTIDAGFYTPDTPEPPTQVGGVTITRPAGSLPVTGGQASQLVAFALSLVGAGILLTGFFTQRKRKLRFY